MSSKATAQAEEEDGTTPSLAMTGVEVAAGGGAEAEADSFSVEEEGRGERSVSISFSSSSSSSSSNGGRTTSSVNGDDARGANGEGAAGLGDAVAPAPEKKKYAYRPPRLGDSFQATVPSFGSEVRWVAASLCGLSLAHPSPPPPPPPPKHNTTQHKQTSHVHRARVAKKASKGGAAADLRPNQLSLRDGLIWDPNTMPEQEVDQYLIFSRGLVDQTTHSRDRHVPHWRRYGISATGLPVSEAEEMAAGGPELIPIEADEQALFYLFQQKYNVDMASLRLTSELGMRKGR